jgi:hypothetical protein
MNAPPMTMLNAINESESIHALIITRPTMKLIDVPSLTDVNVQFNSFVCPGVALLMRVELYSCKATAATRSLARSFDDDVQLRASPSLDEDTALALNRKTLLYLLDTLNEALPDYDFSHTKIDQFALLPSAPHVRAQIDSHLSSCIPNYSAAYADQLWRTIAAALDSLDDVEIYTYVADDPFVAADADRSDVDDNLDDNNDFIDAVDLDDDDAGAADDHRRRRRRTAAASSTATTTTAAKVNNILVGSAGGGGGDGAPAAAAAAAAVLLSSSPFSGGIALSATTSRQRRRRRGTLPKEPLWSFNYFFFDRKRKRVMLWYAFVRAEASTIDAPDGDNLEWEMD